MTKLFLMVVFLTQSAFAMSNQELTSRVISDPQFIQSVESNIMGTFTKPAAVTLKFDSVGAAMSKAPYFYAGFEYWVKAGSVQFGLCSFTVLGELQPDSSLTFVKVVHEDCGE
jgi:hypothetical protein